MGISHFKDRFLDFKIFRHSFYDKVRSLDTLLGRKQAGDLSARSLQHFGRDLLPGLHTLKVLINTVNSQFYYQFPVITKTTMFSVHCIYIYIAASHALTAPN